MTGSGGGEYNTRHKGSDSERSASIARLQHIPSDRGAPIFEAPWQAQAFALAARLQAQGYFTWSEWCERMNRAITAAQVRGDPDLGDTYYEHWLDALESIVIEKSFVGAGELAQRREQWRHAYEQTPHGEPVVLAHDRRSGKDSTD